MQTATLSSKHQIVIPKEAREAMNVKAHDKLLVVVKDNVTVILPMPQKYSEALAGLGKGVYKSGHVKAERRSW